MPNRQKQQGVVLITALIFLVVLTLISVASMRTTGLEEKMAANALNQDLAFQAAEAALREGTQLVISGVITPASDFISGCTTTGTGLCLPSTTSTPIWQTVLPFGQTASSGNAQTYMGMALTGAAIQPQYIIELLPNISLPPGNSLAIGRNLHGGIATPYRITARGWGRGAEAQVTIQSSYLSLNQ